MRMFPFITKLPTSTSTACIIRRSEERRVGEEGTAVCSSDQSRLDEPPRDSDQARCESRCGCSLSSQNSPPAHPQPASYEDRKSVVWGKRVRPCALPIKPGWPSPLETLTKLGVSRDADVPFHHKTPHQHIHSLHHTKIGRASCGGRGYGRVLFRSNQAGRAPSRL